MQAELTVNCRRPFSLGNSPHKLGKDVPKRTCVRTVIARYLTKSFSKASTLRQSPTAQLSVPSSVASNVDSLS